MYPTLTYFSFVRLVFALLHMFYSLGYEVRMWYTKANPGMIGNHVVQGQKIATHLGVLCGCDEAGMEDHIYFKLYFNDVIVDPTNNTICNPADISNLWE